MLNPRRAVAIAVCAALAGVAASGLAAGEETTSAAETAESWFAALRKSAAGKDEKTLAAALPTKLVEGWTEEAKDDGAAWRAEFAARIAAGEVVRVLEKDGAAVARWKTTGPDVTWDLPLARTGSAWGVASPWAYCVAGGDLSRSNRSGPAKTKLRARTSNDSYGDSAFSFTHATGDMTECKNRPDIWYCANCAQLHVKGGLASDRGVKTLRDIEGLQTGGEWQKRFAPKAGAVYAFALKQGGRRDFQAAVRMISVSARAIEFEWCLLAAGRNAPADIHSPQPIVSNDGEDGCDGLCGPRGK
jgi:hypothetical protein